VTFLLVSIPARMMRFVVVTSVAAFSSYYLRRMLSMRVLYGLHLALWVGFYTFYFSVMPS
jgi:hypothetical protein